MGQRGCGAGGRNRPGQRADRAGLGQHGDALAFVCAAKCHRLILTISESILVERRKMLQLLGAELEPISAEQGMRGAVERARQLVAP
jgi:cysteine synthase